MPTNAISVSLIPTIKKEDLVIFIKEIDSFLANKLPDLYKECSAQMKIEKLLDAIDKIETNHFLYSICVGEFAKEVRNRTKIRASHIGNRSQSRKNRICIKDWTKIKNSFENADYEELLLTAEKLLDEAWSHLSEFYVQADCKNIRRNLAKYKKNQQGSN